MNDETGVYEDDTDPRYAATMLSCPYYNGIGQCGGGCYEEPICHVDEPEEGWAHYVPDDFDMEAHRRRAEERRKAAEIERWLAAEKRWLERPVLEEMTETGVYPINPRCPMYERGTRFAAYFQWENGSNVTSWHETEEQARAKLVEHVEFDRKFWEEKVVWKEQGDRTTDDHWGRRKPTVSPFRDVVRVNGTHYTAGYLGIQGGLGDHRGFGGTVFRWRWLDDPSGKTYETNSMWFQGRIPDEFQDRLPDNAEWVKP